MEAGSFRFDRFRLDPANRLLWRDDEPLELNARYFDALVLLVRERGNLVPKSRFLDEVWSGVPVTDEALTQGIKTLRRLLGDDAASPRFIATVPKHGYRFVMPVDDASAAPAARPVAGTPRDTMALIRLGLAATAGAAAAGIIGGLIYGLAATTDPAGSGMGSLSVLAVLVALTLVVAILGGAGVGFGIATATLATTGRRRWSLAGGALGGLFVGASVKLIAVDSIALLFGSPPGAITGAGEGLLLGAAVGGAAALALFGDRPMSLRRSAALAALCGGLAGLAVSLAGGRLMAGSLAAAAQAFPGSRLDIGQIGRLFGEEGFGPIAQSATAMLEGALFAAFLVGAMHIAGRLTTRR